MWPYMEPDGRWGEVGRGWISARPGTLGNYIAVGLTRCSEVHRKHFCGGNGLWIHRKHSRPKIKQQRQPKENGYHLPEDITCENFVFLLLPLFQPKQITGKEEEIWGIGAFGTLLLFLHSHSSPSPTTPYIFRTARTSSLGCTQARRESMN